MSLKNKQFAKILLFALSFVAFACKKEKVSISYSIAIERILWEGVLVNTVDLSGDQNKPYSIFHSSVANTVEYKFKEDASSKTATLSLDAQLNLYAFEAETNAGLKKTFYIKYSPHFSVTYKGEPVALNQGVFEVPYCETFDNKQLSVIDLTTNQAVDKFGGTLLSNMVVITTYEEADKQSTNGIFSKNYKYEMRFKSAAPAGYRCIETPDGLINALMLNNAGKNFLYKDVDMANKSFTPKLFGSTATSAGVFDGNNKTIKNLSIDNSASNTSFVALFSEINGTATQKVTVQNLILESVQVKGGAAIGVLAGYTSNATLKNIRVVNSKIMPIKEFTVGSQLDNSTLTVGPNPTALVGQVVGLLGKGTTVENIQADNVQFVNEQGALLTQSPSLYGYDNTK
jgi:hypothetical protein